MRLVMIANPGTKRCEFFRHQAAAWKGELTLEVVPWAEVIARDGCLDDLAPFDAPAIVRLESPGKDDTVTRLLLEAGVRDNPTEPAWDWRAQTLPKGLLLRPGLLYRGFRRVLRGLRQAFEARPHLRPTACPLAIAAMFDKTVTAWKLKRRGVPVPPMLPPAPDSTIFLLELKELADWPRVYVKLNTGSSATGMVVLHIPADDTPIWGLTTLQQMDGQFYNTRRVRTIRNADLQVALQFLWDEGVIIQRGIPMAQINGRNFDVRVVCVYGQPVATIFRLSHLPITNLHLGGRRGDYRSCRATIPTRAWLDALDHASEAAQSFDAAIAGVDLVFECGYHHHYILEVNAFGDFFPGWLDPSGRSIPQIELDAFAERLA
ncbi:MAG: STM4014 family protein [Gemmataceae bacterium]|nr:STM4014 family protein [Gemmata sp.]MDW8199253.1 STM4014 family protein [Gemmataceae bacterium]